VTAPLACRLATDEGEGCVRAPVTVRTLDGEVEAYIHIDGRALA
jgi:hypothetical protein